MNYDKNEQGGIFAMVSLFRNFTPNWMGKAKKAFLILLSIIGASFICGDGVITPAISVLSALEGITVVAPGLHDAVIVIACVILVLLFILQSTGTSSLGFLFGPIVLLWMLILGSTGIYNVVMNSNANIWRFFNPYYGYLFFSNNGVSSLRMLGGIVLCITGVEAMYADIGHFGKSGVRIALLFVVFPCVMLAYIGQGAHLLNNPEDYAATFYKSLPPYEIVFWGILVVATLATIIASQAMITGTFSLLSQAMTLDYFPKLKVKHTSYQHHGQIYIPFVNYALLIITMIIVMVFQSSASLASAYGIAVVTVLIIDSIMVSWLNYENSWFLKSKNEMPKLHNFWILRFIVIILILGICLPLEVVYLVANYIKIPTGGWLSLVIGSLIASLMFLWTIGLYYLRSTRTSVLKTYPDIDEWLKSHFKSKLPGTGIFLMQKKYEDMPMGNEIEMVPEYFEKMIQKLDAVYENVVFVIVKFYPIPKIDSQEKYRCEKISDTITLITIGYGFYEKILHLTKSFEELEKTLGINLTELHHHPHFYQEKRHVSPNHESWFFFRYPVKMFALLFNNTRNGDYTHLHVPHHQLFEYGVKIVLPPLDANPEKEKFVMKGVKDHDGVEMTENPEKAIEESKLSHKTEAEQILSSTRDEIMVNVTKDFEKNNE